MKNIIGVMPLWDEERDSIWMLPGYLDGIRQAGGLPFVFPFCSEREELEQLCGMCDGFLFTGGHDVAPELYHEVPQKDLVVSCEKRDVMEKIVLEIALAQDKSVLGICRGIQLINVLLGGTLYQDLPTQHGSEVDHHQNPPYHVPVHEVHLQEGSPLQDLLQVDTLPVNSYHHQAIKTMAPGLREMAVSTDGLIEAVYMPEKKFLWAVQWHPEFSYRTDLASRKILEAFVRSMD